ncbi:hypothetical protein A966_05338 [Brachyspira hampsonii 30446]|uniref:Uncharacterized protein n=2 Tax=Brachyspira TaxID=29521 RepID=A0A2U4EWC0_9SPIR|nr:MULTISPECIES: hypothetical protein [Brachyspira]EKV57275.1 hypothetical protein A966_05338 [Brachyspira hampsonii 30446]MBW5394773.1 hypothetical protein [Brachyspira hampsonii]OEJ18593.1 hypothetical protein A9495_05905 [Brachyspira hampsonii]PPS22503.1 hypothetical protein DJ52_04415 [Brachyspira murdochii]
MVELLSLFIQQLNSSVIILVIILIFIIFLTYKLGKWSEKFSNQDNKLSKIDDISDRLIKVETKIDLIYQHTNKNSPIMSNSPISLTDVGQKISKDMNANEILKKYLDKLENDTSLKDCNSAYDIQKNSMDLAKNKLIEYLNEEELLKVKNQAYNYGILVEDIMSIFGILLRNYILDKRGMSIHDIDKGI